MDGDVGRASVELAARAALNVPDAHLLEWRVDPLGGGFGATMGWNALRRVTGAAAIHGERRAWSVVLKSVRPHPERDNPADVLYWQREALVYRSGMVDEGAPGFRAPRLFAAEEREDGEVRLWLEDVAEATGLEWPLERYYVAARHVGRFNGVYLAGRPLPDEPWLPRLFVRSWVDRWHRTAELQLPLARSHPEAGRFWPPDLHDCATMLWARRGELYAALDRQAQTLCHGDINRRNLLAARGADGEAETVAVDWAFSGLGAPGQDVAQMARAAVFAGAVPIDRYAEIEDGIFEAYGAGLRDAGWQGDLRPARLGFTASTALWATYLRIGIADVPLDDQEMWSRVWQRPFADVLELFAEIRRRQLALVDEAFSLAATL